MMTNQLKKRAAGLMLFCGLSAITGCESHDYSELDTNGFAVVEGNYLTKLKAPDDGQVSVYDVTSDKTIWNGAISKGQMLVLNPPAKQLTLSGSAVNLDDLHSGHTLKIMFAPVNPKSAQ